VTIILIRVTSYNIIIIIIRNEYDYGGVIIIIIITHFYSAVRS